MRFGRNLLLVTAATLLAACSAITITPPTSSVAPCWRSPLTDLCGERTNPVVVAKIDDVIEARPQFNLNSADVVIVEQVEGGLTRLFAVYQAKSPELIGPIRSARITDLDLTPAFGTPGFAYSGSASRLVPYLRSAQLQLVGAPQGADGYFRIDDRAAPHNYLATLATIRDRIPDPMRAGVENIVGWTVEARPTVSGIKVQTVEVRWPASKKSFTWDGHRWQMTASDQALLTQTDLSGTTEPVTAANVLIMQSELQDSPFQDKRGSVTPYSKTTGSNDGYVLEQGQLIKATWRRNAFSELPQWFDEAGKPIPLTRGRTWWLIVGDISQVTVQK